MPYLARSILSPFIFLALISCSSSIPLKTKILKRTPSSEQLDSYIEKYRAPRLMTSYTQESTGVVIQTSTFPVRIDFVDKDIVKLRFANHENFRNEHTYSVDENIIWKRVKVKITDTESELILSTPAVKVLVNKNPVLFKILDLTGHVLLEQQDGLIADEALDYENKTAFMTAQKRLIIGAKFKLNSKDHFYGLGEKFRGLYDQSIDWRERKRDANAHISQMGNRFEGADGGANGNIIIPFVVNPNSYGMFLDTVYKTYWEFDGQDSWYVKQDCDQDWEAGVPRCEKSEMRFYIIASKKVPRILKGYSEITGKALMPPRWMLGYLQSNYGYRNWNEVKNTVERLQAGGYPVDGLFLDLQWFGGVPGMYTEDGSVDPYYNNCAHRRVGSLTWSENGDFNFSNAKSNLNYLKNLGVHVVPIEEGYFDICNTSLSSDNNNFIEGQERGFFAKKEFSSNQAALFASGDDSQESNLNEIGYFGKVAMIDTSTKEARSWFWSKHKSILQDGAATFWTDLGEPERFRWWWKYNNNLWHQDIHNVWDLNRARAFFEGFSKDFPEKRPFILSRSGYAGSQRFGVGIWSADAPSQLGWAAAQTSAHLNLAVSGITYTTSDVGGFGGFPVATPEQFTRWLQMETFSSMVRVHGNTTSGRNKERLVHPDEFPEPFKSINKKYINWRESLVPYIYTHAREAYDTGMPLIRALPLVWPNDPRVQDDGSQYLLGPSILVVPYLQGPNGNPNENRNIYFPEGRWVDMHDGTEYKGPLEIQNYFASIDRMPLFAKAGAIIPKAPVLSSLSAPGWIDSRIFEIYPSTEMSKYFLYDDDGTSNGYKNNSYSRTEIMVKPGVGGSILIDVFPMIGNYKPLTQRKYSFEIHSLKPRKVFWNKTEIASDWDENRKMILFSLFNVAINKIQSLRLE